LFFLFYLSPEFSSIKYNLSFKEKHPIESGFMVNMKRYGRKYLSYES